MERVCERATEKTRHGTAGRRVSGNGYDHEEVVHLLFARHRKRKRDEETEKKERETASTRLFSSTFNPLFLPLPCSFVVPLARGPCARALDVLSSTKEARSRREVDGKGHSGRIRGCVAHSATSRYTYLELSILNIPCMCAHVECVLARLRTRTSQGSLASYYEYDAYACRRRRSCTLLSRRQTGASRITVFVRWVVSVRPCRPIMRMTDGRATVRRTWYNRMEIAPV